MPRVLTEREVVEARQSYLKGNVSMSELADAFGITKAAAQCVLNGTNWPGLLKEGEYEALAKVRRSRQPQLRMKWRNGNDRRS